MKMVKVRLKGSTQDIVDIIKRYGRYNRNDTPERKLDIHIGLSLIDFGYRLKSKDVVRMAKRYLKPS